MLDEALEQIVAGDEIGFGIDLDDHALETADRDADQALGGNAPGFLGRLGQALLAQPIDRRLHVAIRLSKRRLAIHHAGAGLVAKLLDHLSA